MQRYYMLGICFLRYIVKHQVVYSHKTSIFFTVISFNWILR